jgi:hypothetical protein
MTQIFRDPQSFLYGAQLRVMIVGGVVNERARSVIGDHDRGDVPTAEIRRARRVVPAAALRPGRLAVVLVKGYDDGGVGVPGLDRGRLDSADQVSDHLVATRDPAIVISELAFSRS